MADSYFHSYLDPEYYESLERYKPSSEYLDIVQRHIGSSWKILCGGYWTRCWPQSATHLEHGWKIHLSATVTTAVALLERVAPLLGRSNASFKFCADANMLRLSLNKNASRAGAGKFITLYPATEEHFKAQLEELHQVTHDLWGPYLLTDRPYKNSKVVFYRYGTHWSQAKVTHDGHRLSVMRAPDGTWVQDERRPCFVLPHWVKDPFAPRRASRAPKSGGSLLLKNRYRVEEALKFNTTGGIYRAVDTQSGAPVIIREARPLTSSAHEAEESFRLLEKEARILRKLQHTGYTPKFIDLFQEWEHKFLVQERLDAESLWGYAIGFSRGSDELRVSHFFTSIRDTAVKIAAGLKALHEHNVVLRDLTRTNVMFTKGRQVKFIDLEFAYELDGDEPYVRSWTEGHSSPEQRRWERPKPGDDCYSLGALILDQIVFTAPGLDLNREGILRSFRQSLEDYQLPMELYEIVLGLLDPDPARRWDLDRVVAAFAAIEVPRSEAPLIPLGNEPPYRPPPRGALITEIEQTLEGMSRFILAKADYSRSDRLWPTRGEVFDTNPLNLDHGAAGTAYFLHRLNGGVPAEAVDWMLEQLERHLFPSGLFSGLSGIALVLQELGQHEAARKAMEAAANSDLHHGTADLFWGDAGWGLANLHFWRHTGEEKYLTRACEVAEHLMRTKKESAQGVYWETDGEKRLGLGHGQAGVALFLIYLAMARPREAFLETAIRAIDFEIAHCRYVGNILLWHSHADAQPGDPKTPHTRYGTAGVGTVVLRGYLATGETRLRQFADRCANTLSDRHTNKLWLNYGLAGYGEFLLDMHRWLGGDQYLNCAFFLAEAILPHRIVKEEGIAFAAQDLLRISCDLGGGSAGIGLFLHRLLHPEQPRFLMLDELLGTPQQRQERG
jgi:serine/threonine protein kinase/rhamnogalacturonyl hydrolase YesR